MYFDGLLIFSFFLNSCLLFLVDYFVRSFILSIVRFFFHLCHRSFVFINAYFSLDKTKSSKLNIRRNLIENSDNKMTLQHINSYSESLLDGRGVNRRGVLIEGGVHTNYISIEVVWVNINLKGCFLSIF